jgi:hypothetical protein
MQLHPHFLFNTLNTISVLMKKDVGVIDEVKTRQNRQPAAVYPIKYLDAIQFASLLIGVPAHPEHA